MLPARVMLTGEGCGRRVLQGASMLPVWAAACTGAVRRPSCCLRGSNIFVQWFQRSVCLCFTITIYCLSICLAGRFCVLIPSLQCIARNFRTCEWFQRPAGSSASSRIYVAAGAELQCHKLFICSYYIMGICRLLSPVLLSCLCANTSLISWKEAILYIHWLQLQEKAPQ